MYCTFPSLPFKGEPNFHSDFYLKEWSDGDVSFESVSSPGSYISVQSAGQSPVTSFSMLFWGMCTISPHSHTPPHTHTHPCGQQTWHWSITLRCCEHQLHRRNHRWVSCSVCRSCKETLLSDEEGGMLCIHSDCDLPTGHQWWQLWLLECTGLLMLFY